MTNFKDFLDEDVDVFINLDEFADIHTIDGIELKCVIDTDIYDERGNASNDRLGGVFNDMISVFVYKDLIERPNIDELMEIDDEYYKVVGVKSSERLYEIKLSRNTY